jgi:hypothetical protein
VSRRSHFIEDPTNTVLTGLPFLTIDASPQKLEERAGVAWTPEDTELGPSLLSRFRLGRAGPRFSLRYFPEARYPGIVVSSDAEATDADVDALLASLGVGDEEIIDRVPVAGPKRARSSPRGQGRLSSSSDESVSMRRETATARAASRRRR